MSVKQNSTEPKPSKAEATPVDNPELCGIVMPISGCDGCTDKHWADVYDILHGAVTEAGFQPRMVSTAEEVGIIQARIIENLYNNPVVVCDVSGKNPNVMFELGMRLAFDKPTVIVKDDRTGYSFDTSPIEHLTYPRDLRYQTIQAFRRTLTEKVRSTWESAKQDTTHSSFLKHFGPITPARLDKHEVSELEYVRRSIESLQATCLQLTQSVSSLAIGEEPGGQGSAIRKSIAVAHDLRDLGFGFERTFQELVARGYSPETAKMAVSHINWPSNRGNERIRVLETVDAAAPKAK